MKDSIWAIYHHMIREDGISLEKQHDKCPKGPDSWCKFWSDRSSYNESKRLPSVFINEMEKTFNDLTDDVLLNRCLKGLTQNQNEALNSVLWSKAIKTKFIGRKRLLIAVCNTICQFNTGSAHKASLLESFGLSAGMNSLTGFHKADEERIKNADRKTSLKSRTRRRKLRGLRKSKGEKVKTTYHPGAFGT